MQIPSLVPKPQFGNALTTFSVTKQGLSNEVMVVNYF